MKKFTHLRKPYFTYNIITPDVFDVLTQKAKSMPRGDKSYISQIKDSILSRLPGEIQETKYGIILSTTSRLYPTYIFEMGSEFLVKISYKYLLPHQKEGDVPVTLFYRCYSSEGLVECLMFEMKLVIK